MGTELIKISKSYGKKPVLKDISLSVSEGEIVGILGENGSGKSTLLSILAGVEKCDSGSFLVSGKNLFEKQNSFLFSELTGYVPQNSVLFEELSARDNLRLWYSKSELEKSLSDGGVLNLLGINAFLKTTVSKMSGGMKKRLSIGCAAARNPKILLLDEPGAALDLGCKAKLYSYYKEFAKNGGILFIVTHDESEIALCTKKYILENGEARLCRDSAQ
ncbi:ABC transporter ATP-binding protein [Treponema sp.]|uniref:ABC transporter ATP-binding protein n=1 Tax=Treponema sp. TaxID=166 RepID=UPI00389073A8